MKKSTKASKPAPKAAAVQAPAVDYYKVSLLQREALALILVMAEDRSWPQKSLERIAEVARGAVAPGAPL